MSNLNVDIYVTRSTIPSHNKAHFPSHYRFYPKENKTTKSCFDLIHIELEVNDYGRSFPQSISDCACDYERESRMEEEE
jgi:hypothetical protein